MGTALTNSNCNSAWRRHLPTTTPGFCVPWDSPTFPNGPRAANCVYLLAITPHHTREAAQVAVLAASSQGGQTVLFLDEGLPVYGSVRGLRGALERACTASLPVRIPHPYQVIEQPSANTDANYVYYSFTASLGSAPPPAVQLTLNAFNGRAEM